MDHILLQYGMWILGLIRGCSFSRNPRAKHERGWLQVGLACRPASLPRPSERAAPWRCTQECSAGVGSGERFRVVHLPYIHAAIRGILSMHILVRSSPPPSACTVCMLCVAAYKLYTQYESIHVVTGSPLIRHSSRGSRIPERVEPAERCVIWLAGLLSSLFRFMGHFSV
jgi:hypothetical protein